MSFSVKTLHTFFLDNLADSLYPHSTVYFAEIVHL